MERSIWVGRGLCDATTVDYYHCEETSRIGLLEDTVNVVAQI